MKYFGKVYWRSCAALLAITAIAGFARLPIFDDAYITYRYARNWARGLGPVFNVGEQVEGYTTFLQTALLAPAIRLGVDPRMGSLLVSILCVALIAAWGATHLNRGKTSETDNRPVYYAAVIVTAPPMMHWALSGMETVWYAAAVFAATMLLIGDIDASRLPWRSALAALMAAMLRPDGFLIAAALGLAWLLWSRERRWLGGVVFALVVLIPYGLYFAWRLDYYGHLFPNTYYAKVGEGGFVLRRRGLEYAIRSALSGGFTIIALWMLRRARRFGAKVGLSPRVMLMVIGAQFFEAFWTGGDYLPFYRFVLPVWPLCILVVLECAALPRGDDPEPVSPFWSMRRGRRWVRYVLMTFILLGIADMNGLKAIIASGLTRNWESRARALNKIIPEDAVVAATAIGAAGWFMDRPLIDMMGLTDETIAHTPLPTGKNYAGHEKYNTDYVLSRRPAVVMLCMMELPKPLEHCPEVVEGFAMMPARIDMLKTERFSAEYVYANHPFGRGFFATFVRRDLIGQPGYEQWFVHVPAPGVPDEEPGLEDIFD